MRKVFRLFKFLLFTILISIGYFVVDRYIHNTVQITPYPFDFNIESYSSQELAADANILIVGDRMGKALDPYLPKVINDSSKGLKDKIKIFNWSSENEFLGRSLNKLKSLKKLPEVIIYHSASQEMFEKTFYVGNKRRIFDNFKIHDDDLTLSVLMSFPILSRFIYWPVQRLELKDGIKKDLGEYTGTQKQTQLEIAFKIYQYLFQNLIELIRAKGSQLIIITTPINLEIAPKRECQNSVTNEILIQQNEINKFIAANKYKEAFNLSKDLIKLTPANARTHYLLGLSAINTGQFKFAKKHLTLAASFDCEPWRIHPVYNAIMKKKAKENNIHIIDFDKNVNELLGKDSLFIDEIHPQNIFYQRLSTSIVKYIKLIFDL